MGVCDLSESAGDKRAVPLRRGWGQGEGKYVVK